MMTASLLQSGIRCSVQFLGLSQADSAPGVPPIQIFWADKPKARKQKESKDKYLNILGLWLGDFMITFFGCKIRYHKFGGILTGKLSIMSQKVGKMEHEGEEMKTSEKLTG